jgi:hypothetical protein
MGQGVPTTTGKNPRISHSAREPNSGRCGERKTKRDRGKGGKGKGRLTCSRGDCCGTAGALFARGRLELALSLAVWPCPSFSFLLAAPSSSSSSSSSSRARIASRRASTQSITRPIEGGVSESDTVCWTICSRSAQAAAYPELYARFEVEREDR